VPLIDVNDYTIYTEPGSEEIGSTQLIASQDPNVLGTLWRYEPDASVRSPLQGKIFSPPLPSWHAMFEYVVPLDYVGGGLELTFDVELRATGDITGSGNSVLEVYARTVNGGPTTPYPLDYPAGAEVLEFHSSGTDLRQILNTEGLVRMERTFVIPPLNRSELDPAGIAGYIADGSGGASSMIPPGTAGYGPGDTISVILAGYNSSAHLGVYVWTEIYGGAGPDPPDTEYIDVAVDMSGAGLVTITARSFEEQPPTEDGWECATPAADPWACATPDDDEWACVDDVQVTPYGVLIDVDGNDLTYINGGRIKLI
jgi:hypothetical protein